MRQNGRAIGWKWWTEFAITPQVEEIEVTEKTEQKEVAEYEQ